VASELKKLLEQIHHRSLWQTLVAYAVASWAVLGGMGTLMDILGLPDWVPPTAAVICIALLPLVLATAYIQKRGIGGPELVTGAPEEGLRRWFSWRHVAVAAGVTFALLASGTGGYMGMRVMGVGPWGTLTAKGLIPENARILVADFSAPSGDSVLALGLSQLIRNDLASSPAVHHVDPQELQPTLEAMRLSPGAALTEALAKDAAEREGIPAVLVGELTPFGESRLITARLVDPVDNTVLLRDEARASSEEDLLGSDEDGGPLDRMLARLRERMGESFGSIRNREPLWTFSTSSVEALKLYIEAVGLQAAGERPRARALLEEAVVLDSTFAVAWRRLGALRESGPMQVEASTRAYELADRLPDLDRWSVTAWYYWVVLGDRRRAIETYELGLDEYPEANLFRNSLGNLYRQEGEFEKSLAARRESLDYAVNQYTTANAVEAALTLNDLETARYAVALRKEHLPGHPDNPFLEGWVAYRAGDLAEARRLFEAGLQAPDLAGSEYRHVADLGRFDALQGRLGTIEDRWRGASFYKQWWMGLYYLIAVDSSEQGLARTEAWVEGLDYLNIAPEDRAVGDLVSALAILGRPSDARSVLEEWKRAVSEETLVSDSVLVIHAEADIALAEARTDEGLALYRRATQSFPPNAAAEGMLAWWYDRIGMSDSALVAYHRYLDAPNAQDYWWDPIFLPRVYERLGQLHEEREEWEEAAKYHALFVELWADADPELQPRVQAAREALERLRGRGEESGSGGRG
jgi:Flp pilus assembly protein TadD